MKLKWVAMVVLLAGCEADQMKWTVEACSKACGGRMQSCGGESGCVCKPDLNTCPCPDAGSGER